MKGSFRRIKGVLLKELLQLKRERLTFGMIVMQPVVMLMLFGYAINSDPKNLPIAIIGSAQSEFTRTLAAGMENSGYFKISPDPDTEEKSNLALQQGKVQFVLTIPSDFTKKILRGEKPQILLEADATDPVAVAPALASMRGIVQAAVVKDFPDAGKYGVQPYEMIVHYRYNPEQITQYNIVPGFVGVILTMTLIMMTALSMTREREKGTMENLLVMPIRPVEVVLGKLSPYVVIGMLQASFILVLAYFLFNIPFVGSVYHILLVVLLFEVAVLMVGITISSVAKSQLQAMQMTIFFFLPNLFLSGFMFPFRGMPAWAQAIGSVAPLTYFIRMIRGIVLKGNTLSELWPNIWPLLIFISVMMAVALKAYKKTLD